VRTSLIRRIPAASGGSPVYDAITLAYAEEFRSRGDQRNALIILSDGLDNQFYQQGVPSEVNFGKLAKAAESMHALFYPVFLDPTPEGEKPKGYAQKARRNLEELAEATGGRLFRARSVSELDPVYPQVEEELRSVYTLAYYPQNQDFNGEYRSIEVKVNRPGAIVRARAGYTAR
jgi:VWFA-related protein